jgi:CDP-glycerol glycerophosphotransferase
MEVYGKTDFERVEPLREDDYGYIDILNVRNSYPEGKRMAENMCYSYAKEYDVPIKVARLAQTIGASVDYRDGRVFAQFARNIVERKDIVLKTEGKSIRSYCYITDCVSAIFAMLERGKNGKSYNVANPDTTCSIKEMAEMLCDKYTSSKLKFELDTRCYPVDSKMFLDVSALLEDTGWHAQVTLEEMFDRLLQDMYLRPKKLVEGVHKKVSGIKKILQWIFEITNDALYKRVTVLGLSFQFVHSQKYKDFFEKYEINNNKIVFEDKHGRGFSGNLKYIAEELLKQNTGYDLVWLDVSSKDVPENFPKGIRVVKTNTVEGMKELATAKIWIGAQVKSYLVRDGLIKKDGQYYIQTWHGSLGIKRIGADVNSLTETPMDILDKKEAQMLDYLISNSDFETNVYRNAFYGQGKTLLYGHARNDIFFRDNAKIKKKVYDYYNISEDKKIILYAPTFRDDYDFSAYDLDYLSILNTFEKQFNSECILAFRIHPKFTKYKEQFIPKSDKIIDFTSYDDIQELLVSSDIVITDYSSCIFDFMLTRKPAFIYASDIEKYNTDRGFYYPLETTPFPIATNNDEMMNNIQNFDYENYKSNVEKFLEDKGCIDDGHASERVVELIKRLMNDAES